MVVNSITELVGKTPIIKLNKITKGLKCDIYVKLEGANPLSSVKDRVALQMIEDAETRGDIDTDTLLIEATSGNTGIGLAFVGAAKGYKVAIVMPDTMSIERQKLLKALGAELILTPGELGMKGAIAKSEELQSQKEKSYIMGQFENPANPKVHRLTTALEIIEDFPDGLDVFISGVGTGGTITGTGQILKNKFPNIYIVAIEPKGSPVLSGEKGGSHKLQGIGAGFIPGVLDTSIYNEVIKIGAEESGIIARRMAREEGLLLGISSGAGVKAALELAKRKEFQGKKILVISPSSGERYLSTWLYN